MTSRRNFLAFTSLGATQLALTSVALGQAAGQVAAKEQKEEEEVGPAEDLMREHGVLRRILLVYDDQTRKIGEKQPLDADVLAGAAGIIRRFVEEYHEKLEEQHLFPRFQKAGSLLVLVKTLTEQHEAGRRVTARILEVAKPATLTKPETQLELSHLLQTFTRMYRPHAAREDTVLFPAFHKMLPSSEYGRLGDQFEARENELFGKEGFEKVVGQVAELERRLGIENLSQFTPKAG